MFFKTKKTVKRIDEETKDEIIKEYLEKIQLAYKSQPIVAERMIEMELALLMNRRYAYASIDQQD